MSMKNFPVHSQQLILYKTEWNPDFCWWEQGVMGTEINSGCSQQVSGRLWCQWGVTWAASWKAGRYQKPQKKGEVRPEQMLGGTRGCRTAKDLGMKSWSVEGGWEQDQLELIAGSNPLETPSRREGASCASLIQKGPDQPSSQRMERD